MTKEDMDISRSVSLLYEAIKTRSFDWKRYLDGGIFEGLSIRTEPTYASYGYSGFKVHFLDHDIVDAIYTTLDGELIFPGKIKSRWNKKLLDIDGERYFMKYFGHNKIRLFKLSDMGNI